MKTQMAQKTDLWLAAALAALLAGLYAAGACRTIYVGDSGELVAAVHTLGIPHPSSYPPYVLLGKLWTLALPMGSIALRMSLFSATCAGVAAALFFLLARHAGLGRPAAIFGALLLAFSASFWSQANIQRVYGLNALALVVAMLLALRWERTRHLGWLAGTMLACGLGASNHMVMLVVGIALALWAVCVERTLLLRPKALL